MSPNVSSSEPWPPKSHEEGNLLLEPNRFTEWIFGHVFRAAGISTRRTVGSVDSGDLLYWKVVAWDREQITFKTYAVNIVTLLVALLGGGEVGAGIILSVIIEEGTVWWYMLGLNGLFFSISGLFLTFRLLSR